MQAAGHRKSASMLDKLIPAGKWLHKIPGRWLTRHSCGLSKARNILLFSLCYNSQRPVTRSFDVFVYLRLNKLTVEFPTQRPVTRSFDVFCHLHLNIPLNKQSWGWWFETRSLSLRRHCNGFSLLWYVASGSAAALETRLYNCWNEL